MESLLDNEILTTMRSVDSILTMCTKKLGDTVAYTACILNTHRKMYCEKISNSIPCLDNDVLDEIERRVEIFADSTTYRDRLICLLSYVPKMMIAERNALYNQMGEWVKEMYPKDWQLYTQGNYDEREAARIRLNNTPIGTIYYAPHRELSFDYDYIDGDERLTQLMDNESAKLKKMREDYLSALAIYEQWREKRAELNKPSADSSVFGYEL